MDLSRFDVKAAADKGADLHLKHPSTGEKLFCKDGKTPFTVRVLGRDARSVQNASKEAAQGRTDGSMTELESGQHVLAAALVGWCDEMELDGEALEYTPANAFRLVSDPRTDWMAEQITPFSLSRKNYSKNMQGS